MKSFKVNDYITLRLTRGSTGALRTSIFINETPFDQCRHLVLNIPKDNLSRFNKINSIDEVLTSDTLLEDFSSNIYISPEEEFWVHCSNIQVWVEQNYDTRLLDCSLSFPLLKELYKTDPIAKRVFKEEIAKRFLSNFRPVTTFLIRESYLDILSDEEFWQLISIELIDKYELIALKEILNKSFRRFYPREKILSNHLDIPYFEVRNGRIVSLNLNDCVLRELPESIGSFKFLRELILSLNYIHKLPDSIKNLEMLEILDISHNPIEQLPDSIRDLKNLKTIIRAGKRTRRTLKKIRKLR